MVLHFRAYNSKIDEKLIELFEKVENTSLEYLYAFMEALWMKHWNHSGKQRNCSLWAISPLATMFSGKKIVEAKYKIKQLNLIKFSSNKTWFTLRMNQYVVL